MPTLYLRTLGGTELVTPEGAVPLSPREAALLGFTCSRRGCRASRADIADLFWPDAEPRKARHSLSQLLYEIRRRVPADLINLDNDIVAVSGCQVDFLELSKDLLEGRMSQVIQRYGGRFLPRDDFGSDELRDWRDQIEEHTAQSVGTALQEQSCACGDAELTQIIRVASEVLSIHPHLVTAQISLLEATARMGDTKEVERLHCRFTKDHSDSIPLLPSISSFLGRRATPRQSGTIRFTGRESEIRSLEECWSEVEKGNGQVAIIHGEPGIGKTRLADHFLRRVAIRGGVTWIARCCAATQRLPYSVASELIRDNVLEIDINSALSVASLNSTDLESDGNSDARRHQLTESLTSLAIGRCANQPLVIFIDDAQWVDDYTALLLSYWSYRLRSHPVLMLLTIRTEEAEPSPDWITSDLGRTTAIMLGRISVEAASQIVDAFESSHGAKLEKELRDAVLWQSGGRPFLLLEALSSVLSDDGSNRPTPHAVLTASAESVLRRRFRNLTTDASALLSALAVWGQEITSEKLSRITGLAGHSFAAALDLLHARGIAYWSAGAVTFPHDLMREAAYRSLMPATRALYHRKAAEDLSLSQGQAGLIAQHYAQAGDSNLAAMHAIQAADEARAAHLFTDYEFYCRLCIEHGSRSQKEQAASKLGRYLVEVGRTPELERIRHLLNGAGADQELLLAVSELEHDLAAGTREVAYLLDRAKRIVTLASNLDELSAAPIVATLIDIALDAGANEFGLHVAEALLPDIRFSSGDDPHRAIASIISVWRGITEGTSVGLPQAEAALAQSPEIPSPTIEALCLASYGTLLLLAGRITESRAQFDLALELATSAGDLRRQLCIFNNNGVALLESGDFARARQNFERVLTTPNIHSRIRGYGNLAILHYEHGEYTSAVRAAENLLTMNSAYKSSALDVLGHSILGLAALDTGNHIEARDRAANVRSLIHGNEPRSDASYPAMLLCRVSVHDGHPTEAIAVIDRILQYVESRDVPCAMRLMCEKAVVLSITEPDRAYALLRQVLLSSHAMGAQLINERARKIKELTLYSQ